MTEPLCPGCRERDARIAALEHRVAADLEAAHLQPVFAGCRCRDGTVARDLFERGLCLPSVSGMTEEDPARVAAVVRSVHRGACLVPAW